MSSHIEKSLLDIDFGSLTRRVFTPSPAAWEDQVLYFLLVDRFSDGNERGGYRDSEGRPVQSGTTPLYMPDNLGRLEYEAWFRAGDGWQGGTLSGLKSKLGYLRRLGITALWVSPIFRQVAFEPSYHGYGIQNFLDVERARHTGEKIVHHGADLKFMERLEDAERSGQAAEVSEDQGPDCGNPGMNPKLYKRATGGKHILE